MAAFNSLACNAHFHVIKGICFFTRLRVQNELRRRVTKEVYVVGTVLGILKQISSIESDFTLRVLDIYYSERLK